MCNKKRNGTQRSVQLLIHFVNFTWLEEFLGLPRTNSTYKFPNKMLSDISAVVQDLLQWL